MGWSRRDFVRIASLGGLAGMAPGLPWTGTPLLGRGASSSLTGRLEFTELRRNVGVFTSTGAGTIGWLLNPDGAVVVDSQFPDQAADCLDGLRNRGADGIDALVNTHHHGDHVAGNGVFAPAARQIVAHERAPQLQREAAREQGNEDAQTYPNATFSTSWRLEVGDETVRARHYRPAHTGGDSTVFFERANVVHMGDLVFDGLHPFIDRPGGASVLGWIELLETVALEHDRNTIFIFGHARPGYEITGSRERLLTQRDYFVELLETTERGIQAGASRGEIAGADALTGFEDYVGPANWITLQAALEVAYDELTQGS